jgi:hypothetical protein
VKLYLHLIKYIIDLIKYREYIDLFGCIYIALSHFYISDVFESRERFLLLTWKKENHISGILINTCKCMVIISFSSGLDKTRRHY